MARAGKFRLQGGLTELGSGFWRWCGKVGALFSLPLFPVAVNFRKLLSEKKANPLKMALVLQ